MIYPPPAGRLNIALQSVHHTGLIDIRPRVRCIRQQEECQRTAEDYVGYGDKHQEVRETRETQPHLETAYRLSR